MLDEKKSTTAALVSANAAPLRRRALETLRSVLLELGTRLVLEVRLTPDERLRAAAQRVLDGWDDNLPSQEEIEALRVALDRRPIPHPHEEIVEEAQGLMPSA